MARGMAGRAAMALATALLGGALMACSGSDPGGGASSSPSAAPAPGFNLPVSQPTVWMCRPGLEGDACTDGLDATVVAADGTSTVEPFAKAADPKVDCFYVYPTVSKAASVAAPLRAEPEVVGTVRAQAARFGEVCRVFAPVYRQTSVQGLFTQDAEAKATASATAYADVVSAWHDYLNSSNGGRGVVLVGHSQGSGMLLRLLKDEIEKEPRQRELLVSALLLGGWVSVPTGEDVGGDLVSVPACRRTGQTGCVIAYNSFDEQPPPASIFGRSPGPGREALCVNPAALGGGPATTDAYLPTARLGTGFLSGVTAEVAGGYGTGFVAYRDYFRVECRSADGLTWLQVDAPAPAGPADPRRPTEPILGPTWGLHLDDANIPLGDLVAVVRAQSDAWPG